MKKNFWSLRRISKLFLFQTCHFCSSVTCYNIAKLSLIHLKSVSAISPLTVFLLSAHTGQLWMSKIRTTCSSQICAVFLTMWICLLAVAAHKRKWCLVYRLKTKPSCKKRRTVHHYCKSLGKYGIPNYSCQRTCIFFLIVLLFTSISVSLKHSHLYNKINQKLSFLWNRVALYPPAKYSKRCTSIVLLLFLNIFLRMTNQENQHVSTVTRCFEQECDLEVNCFIVPTCHILFGSLSGFLSAQTGIISDEAYWRGLLQKTCAQPVKPH